ncbi:hypothetical protein SCA03_31830 [Streptomyces cacaoi]|uniref:Uncharacterized protein n=1 Tax=Streptomyces cacaoi TaxID=1898 RepID=A0A4Y3QZK7_STRCI|nr:hypothetical protein SCA03_31830 [Streptomyces cacaoi]
MNPGKHAAPTAAAARAHEEAPSVPEEGFRDAAGSADARRSDLKAHGDVPGAFRLHARPEDGKTAPAVSARKRLVHIQRESEQLELPAYRNGPRHDLDHGLASRHPARGAPDGPSPPVRSSVRNTESGIPVAKSRGDRNPKED